MNNSIKLSLLFFCIVLVTLYSVVIIILTVFPNDTVSYDVAICISIFKTEVCYQLKEGHTAADTHSLAFHKLCMKKFTKNID